MSRATIRDVARAAGVSLATVDRVLNRRAGVRAATVQRVEEAMRRLDFTRDLAAANLSKKRRYRLTFLLPDGANSFMRELEAAVQATSRQSSMERAEVTVAMVPAFDGPALAKALDGIDRAATDGVAVVATESAEVRAAIDRLRADDVRVVTLVSDLPASTRDRFVGIDNGVAGRTAAGLLGRFCPAAPGRVAVVAGSMLLRDHAERRSGFEQVMRAEYPHLTVLAPLEGLDDAERVAALLGEALAADRDIVGLYSLGAGNRGVVTTLAAAGLGGRIRVVAHELSPHARAALRDGTFDAVINQDAGHEARSAVRILKALIDDRALVEAQERIRIEIFMRDNLP
ncbi:LacI family DNA-binding transcriptional regulator [Aurantimonas sp. A2-1-M11]|uniref:LacI family DNA-binding transcriptional regulator n=1 Tax=Aurantimonas sp. A2-1-M11 TaxID=3113712 RepID=UPI002F92EBCA